MNSVFRIGRYLLKKHNIMLLSIIVVCLFLLVSIMFFLLNTEQSRNKNRESIIENYKSVIELAEIVKEDTSSAYEYKSAVAMIEYYSFFVKNNKIESDYYSTEEMEVAEVYKKEGHEGTAFMFYTLKWFNFIVYILSIAVAMSLFVSELGGQIKNLMATSLRRVDILSGFLLNSVVVVSAINLLAFVIGLVGGLVNSGDQVLLVNHDYKEVSTIVVYIWACLGRYVLSLLFVGLSYIIGIKTKNISLSCVYVVLASAMLVIVGIAIASKGFSDVYTSLVKLMFNVPIVGIEMNIKGPVDDSVWVVIYHAVMAIVLFACSYVLFKRISV